MGVARNVLVDPKLVPGGGAVELSVAAEIKEKSEQIEGVEQVKDCARFLSWVCFFHLFMLLQYQNACSWDGVLGLGDSRIADLEDAFDIACRWFRAEEGSEC
jgi:hypothetical protein